MCGFLFLSTVTVNNWGTLLEVNKYEYVKPTVLDLSENVLESYSSKVLDLVRDKKICQKSKQSILNFLND